MKTSNQCPSVLWRSIHRSSLVLAISVAVVPFVTIGETGAQDTSELQSTIHKLAQPYVDSETVVGLSIGVLKDGQATTVHVGKSDADGSVPDDETVYEIGSVSKVFTGILLADAVVAGKVRLDQDAQELLPDGVTMPKWKDQSIQLVDIATHFSGLPRLPDNMPFGNPENPYADYPSKLAYEFLNKYELLRAPGEKSEYSNFAVGLMGHLISENAGLSYDELLQQRIANPLEMTSTAITLIPAMQERFATPYSAADVPTNGWDFSDMPGAGGIRSTTSDMLRFAKANLNPPDGQLGEALDLAWKKQKPGKDGSFAMGLGWHIARDNSTRWHNGQTGGFHSMILVSRQFKAAVVVLTNTASMEVDQLGNELMQMLAGADIKPREFAKEIQVDEKVLQRYVGKFELVPSVAFTVSVDGGKLMVGLTGQPTFQVFAKSETNWFYKVVPAELTFKLDDDGKCNELELFQNGVRQTAKRVE